MSDFLIGIFVGASLVGGGVAMARWLSPSTGRGSKGGKQGRDE